MLHKNDGDMCDNCYAIHKKAAGKAVDPRLLTILEFYRQLYVRKQEVFKKSFPELHDEFDELFKKHGAKLLQVKSGRVKVQTVERSSSVGSSREISQNDLKLERFKIKTIDFGGDVKQGLPNALVVFAHNDLLCGTLMVNYEEGSFGVIGLGVRVSLLS
ncbi:hypothetical protein SO802_009410 [Lithocarpus litseifolius]|uniref:Uncharacterized protein n=1 Tax=Lithocarpus litseifolius TaxID=425828 RepID=A0AAW2DBD3_9ROSI